MLKTMDPNVIRAMLKDHTDVISQETKKEEEFYKNLSCPMCYGAGCEKRINAIAVRMGEGGPEVASSPFVAGRNLPQGYAHCIHCGTDFDPQTGVIRKAEASLIVPTDLDPAAKIVS